VENKSSFILVEGAQGVGKSSLTSALREYMTSTTLVRLAGLKQNNAMLAYKYHFNMLEMVKQNAYTGMNFVFDRSYLSEQVYCQMGYKPHSFEKESSELGCKLVTLSDAYNIHVVVLQASKRVLEQRLLRDKPQYNDIAFDVEKSFRQTGFYISCAYRLTKFQEISIHILDTAHNTTKEVMDILISKAGMCKGV